MTSFPQDLGDAAGRTGAAPSAGQAPGQQPRIPASARNAPDLSQAGAASSAAPSAPGASGEGLPTYRTDITTGQEFQQLAQLSGQGPVLFALYRGSDQAAVASVEELTDIVDSAQGRFLLAAADIEQSPEIAQALQAATSLTVIAMLGGRPAPLYDQPVPAQQIEGVLGQVLQLAQQSQLTGTFEPVGTRQAAEEKPLPPLHQKARDVLAEGDYEAAEAAYRQAIAEQPGDHEAKIGLARVGLLSRVAGMDAGAVREKAAAAPEDVDAQIQVADLDVTGGHVEDAFGRLLGLIRRTADPEAKNAVRQRLLELFEVVGAEDPRVVAARGQLMRALF